MSGTENTKPPRLLSAIFTWWYGKADMEDLLGDLEEYYLYNLQEKGKLTAQLIYLKQVISLSFSYALRKRKRSASYSSYYSKNSTDMIRNYLKVAVRNFSKHKLFTTINIFGLALGMSVCLLALSIAVAVIRSDEFHDNKERIFQINTFISDDTEKKIYESTFN
ncbi:MAG: permease prefix domain 2-containing transporter, partial [Cyclobacteriaceae bacterium]